jgi:hypothetical protein
MSIQNWYSDASAIELHYTIKGKVASPDNHIRDEDIPALCATHDANWQPLPTYGDLPPPSSSLTGALWHCHMKVYMLAL